MQYKEIENYLSFCFNHKSINILYINSEVRGYLNLQKYEFKSVENLNLEISYSTDDILVIFKKDLENLDLNLLKSHNFKIIILNCDTEISKNFYNIGFKNLYKSNLIKRLSGIKIEVFQKELSKMERENYWQRYYTHHLGKLYENKNLNLIFKFGHNYISKIDKHDMDIVDFGCGNGYHVEFENLETMKNYYFLDININTINYLRNVKNYRNVIQSSGLSIDLPDNSIDYFICSHILEHVPNLNEVVENLYTKIKVGGGIILVAPCDPGFFWNNLTKFSPNRYRLKKLGLDYDEIMKAEHINSIYEVLSVLRKRFKEKNTKYFPFNFLKTTSLNLMYFSIFYKK